MVAGPAGWRWVMWWSMPEAGEQQGAGVPVRRLAVAGSFQRRQRTVLTLVPLRDVHPNPEQPRKHFDDEKLRELAASIKAHGLLQPIVVRPTAAGLELVAGERRFRAAQLAGVDRLPALALWRRLQLGVLSVRRFREEKAGRRPERAAVAEVLAAGRRMNRALARLLADELPASDAPRIARALRRTRRLIDRQLEAVSPPAPPAPQERKRATRCRASLPRAVTVRYVVSCGAEPFPCLIAALRGCVAWHAICSSGIAGGRRSTDGHASSEKARRARWSRAGARDHPSVAVLRPLPDRRIPSAREAAH